jgi:hypothetical protein
MLKSEEQMELVVLKRHRESIRRPSRSPRRSRNTFCDIYAVATRSPQVSLDRVWHDSVFSSCLTCPGPSEGNAIPTLAGRRGTHPARVVSHEMAANSFSHRLWFEGTRPTVSLE